jgi:ABC transporter substrate binding protein
VDRRAFLGALASGLLATPLAAEAQPAGKVWRIGYLTPFPLTGAPADPAVQLFSNFKQALRDLGYVEGQNVVIESRTTNQRPADVPKLVSELVAARVDVLVVQTGSTALRAKRVTSTVPIVMLGSADAVSQGIVASLARPGGNVTGMTMSTTELEPKRLEILKEAVPGLARLTVFWCRGVPGQLEHTEAAAKILRVGIDPIEVRGGPTASEVRTEWWEEAIEAIRRNRSEALWLSDCQALDYARVVAFAVQNRLPTMSPWSAVTRGGRPAVIRS